MSAEEAFGVLDKDGSGAISVGEMSLMLTKGDSAQVLGEAYVQDLIDQVDQNGDGELQLGEFEIFWESFQASAGLQRQVEVEKARQVEEMKARATGIGSSWRRVEGIKPEFGVEISNKELAKALMARLQKNSTVDSVEFSQEEVEGFSLHGLKANAFIKVTLGRGDKARNHYFVQAASYLHRHSHDGDKNHLPIAHNPFHLKRRGLSFERAGARGFADGRAEIADTMLEAEVNAARAIPSAVGTSVQDVSEDAAIQSTRGTKGKAPKDPALLKPAGPRGNPMTNRHRAAFSPGESDEHRVRRLCAELERCDELSGWHSHQPALGADEEDQANFDASYVASYALFKQGATKGGVSPATAERGLGGRAEGSLSRALDANRFAQAAKAVDVMMARLDEVETRFKPSSSQTGVSTAPTVLQMLESESDGPVKIAYMGALAASSHVPSEVRPEYMLRYLLAALEGEERAPPMPTPTEVLQLKLLHWRERRDELAALQASVHALMLSTHEGRNPDGAAMLLENGAPKLHHVNEEPKGKIPQVPRRARGITS